MVKSVLDVTWASGFLKKHLRVILLPDVSGSSTTGGDWVEGKDQVREEEVAEDGYEVPSKLFLRI